MTPASEHWAAAAAAEVERGLAALPACTTESVRALRRQLSKRLKAESARTVLDLAAELLERGTWATRFLAYELINHHPGALAGVDAARLGRLGRDMSGWADVDMFACYVAGPVWRERGVADSVVHGWTRSPDRWWRRAAVVSTVALNSRARGGRGDPDRTLAVCELVVDDRDDMVAKAVSWALRELAKHDAVSVRRFVATHEARLAPRVLREVRNKLTTGRKNPGGRGARPTRR